MDMSIMSLIWLNNFIKYFFIDKKKLISLSTYSLNVYHVRAHMKLFLKRRNESKLPKCFCINCYNNISISYFLKKKTKINTYT